jgi:hypothetical protein
VTIAHLRRAVLSPRLGSGSTRVNYFPDVVSRDAGRDHGVSERPIAISGRARTVFIVPG